MPIPNNPLRWDLDQYVPSITQLLELDNLWSLRKDYTRMRNIAQKRMARLRNSDIGRQSQAYQNYKSGFPTLKELGQSGRKFAQAYARLGRFLSLKTSTITGIRAANEKAIKSLQRAGYNINKKNIADFGQFMETFRDTYGMHARGSESAAELFETLESADITPSEIEEDFAKWMDKKIELEQIVAEGPPEGVNADWFREQLKI